MFYWQMYFHTIWIMIIVIISFCFNSLASHVIVFPVYVLNYCFQIMEYHLGWLVISVNVWDYISCKTLQIVNVICLQKEQVLQI
jgi:hypothetical protein